MSFGLRKRQNRSVAYPNNEHEAQDKDSDIEVLSGKEGTCTLNSKKALLAENELEIKELTLEMYSPI